LKDYLNKQYINKKGIQEGGYRFDKQRGLFTNSYDYSKNEGSGLMSRIISPKGWAHQHDSTFNIDSTEDIIENEQAKMSNRQSQQSKTEKRGSYIMDDVLYNGNQY